MAIVGRGTSRWWSFALAAPLAALSGCETDDPVPAGASQVQNPGPGGGAGAVNSRVLENAAATAPAWQPSAQMLALLSDQRIAVGPYSIRVPIGYTINGNLAPPIRGAAVKVGVLDAPSSAGTSIRRILCMYIKPDPGEPEHNLDDFVKKMLKTREEMYAEFAVEPTEVGRIGDLGFARSRWKGVYNQGGGIVVRGILYVCWDGSALFYMMADALESDQAAIDAAEAAILSLSKP